MNQAHLLIALMVLFIVLLLATAICGLAGADPEGRGGKFIAAFFVLGLLTLADALVILAVLGNVIWQWRHG